MQICYTEKCELMSFIVWIFPVCFIEIFENIDGFIEVKEKKKLDCQQKYMYCVEEWIKEGDCVYVQKSWKDLSMFMKMCYVLLKLNCTILLQVFLGGGQKH